MTLLLVVASPALAQGISSGSGEVVANVGISNLKGIDGNRHPSFGFSGSYNVTDVIAVGFEYNYQMMGSETIGSVTGSEHLQMFGPVARFSLAKSSRAVPYALIAAGGSSLRAVASVQNLSASASQGGFYVGFGGGATIFAGPHWGIRPEFRYERQQFNATTISGISIGSFGQNYSQGTVSVFYQFGGTQTTRK